MLNILAIRLSGMTKYFDDDIKCVLIENLLHCAFCYGVCTLKVKRIFTSRYRSRFVGCFLCHSHE